jgi:four helix bundle protein
MIESYRDLTVWQKAMDLAEEAYRLSRLMPKAEEYRLTSQLLRAAVSVPANIAEGHSRGTRKDYANFINIARGSLAESETLLLLARRTGLLDEAQATKALTLANEVGRMLTALRRSLTAAPR